MNRDIQPSMHRHITIKHKTMLETFFILVAAFASFVAGFVVGKSIERQKHKKDIIKKPIYDSSSCFDRERECEGAYAD